MNYFVMFSNICLITYLLYVFHESYAAHYESDPKIITSYCCIGAIACFVLLFVPLPYITVYQLGYMIILPVYMYYTNEDGILQLLRYFVILIVSIGIVLFLQFLFCIYPNSIVTFKLNLDNVFSCVFSILMLSYLQRRLNLYTKPYVLLITLSVVLLCLFDTYYIIRINVAYDHLLYLFANGLLWILLALFRMLYTMETSNENVLKLTIERYANKENKQKYEIVEKENKMIMQQLHDMKKHLQALDEMQEYKQEVHTYKEEIERKAEELLYVKQTGNNQIDHLLQTYQIKFHKLNLQCNIEVDDIDFSFMSTIDLNALLLNLLDNAMESCEKCKERFLLLKIKKKRNFIILKMKNSCETIIEDHGVLKTTKTDRVYHGYGMRNIAMIANRYGGELHYHFDDEHHVFVTSITLLYDHI